MRCIICFKEKDNFTDEHVFPDAIGGTLIIKNVCKECNDELGHSVDHHLVNDWLIQGMRMLYKIKGKKGNVPNPLEKGVLASNPQQQVRYTFDKNVQPKEFYVFPMVQKENVENGKDVTISVDKKDKHKLPEMINKMLRRNNQPELTIEQIENSSIEIVEPHPTMRQTITIDMVQSQRSILKIAYELAHYWLGEDYFDDPIAVYLINCVRDNNLPVNLTEKYPIKANIGLVGKDESNLFQKISPNHHVAIMLKDKNVINCYIKIFNVYEGRVQVSIDAERYSDFVNRFISIDPVTGSLEETNFVDKILNIVRENDEK